MRVRVLLFAQLAELAETRELYIDAAKDTNDLIKKLETKFPGVKQLPYLVAVGKDLIDTNTPLSDNSTVALLPPYSGG